MREVLFRGKRVNNGEWVYGGIIPLDTDSGYVFIAEPFLSASTLPVYEIIKHHTHLVIPETVGQYTGLTDKNGKRIFEGDIVQYETFDDFDCKSIVKFGEYEQDGSGGEYSGAKCIGFYVKVDNFTCPDWWEAEPENFPYYMWQQNILEVASECEVIGNIYDNSELLKGD